MYREYILNTGLLTDPDNASFQISPPQTVYAFRIISASFIQNWDSTNVTNNKILFAEFGDAGPRTASLKVGNYNSTTIQTAIAEAMTAVGTQPYTCSYDDTTRRLTIATSGGKQFKLLGGVRGSTASLQLGITRSAETGLGTSFVMDAPLNLAACQPILLTSRTLQASNGITYVSGINSDMNVLACISPDAFNDVITWTNPSDNMFQTGEVTLSNVDIQLIDSGTLQQIKTTAPIVVVLGVYDDPSDVVSMM